MELNEKQIEILLVAEDFFSEKGFSGSSVRDIASAAGVNVAMINYYFGSKDNLLQTLIEWRAHKFLLNSADIFIEDDPWNRMERVIAILLNAMSEHRSIYKIVAIEGGVRHRILKSAIFDKLKKHNNKVIDEVLQYGISLGKFNPDSSAVLIHAMIMGMFMNFQFNETDLKDSLNIQTEAGFTKYMQTELVNFLQKSIKLILQYEN